MTTIPKHYTRIRQVLIWMSAGLPMIVYGRYAIIGSGRRLIPTSIAVWMQDNLMLQYTGHHNEEQFTMYFLSGRGERIASQVVNEMLDNNLELFT